MGNPVDLTAQISGNDKDFNRIVELALNDPNMDQMIVRYGTVQGARGAAWATAIAEIADKAGKPMIVSLGRVAESATAAIKIFDAKRIPWVLTPTRTAEAAGALSQFAQKQRGYLAAKARGERRVIAPQKLAFASNAPRLSEADPSRHWLHTAFRLRRNVCWRRRPSPRLPRRRSNSRSWSKSIRPTFRIKPKRAPAGQRANAR